MAWMKGDWWKTSKTVASVFEEKARVWSINQHRWNMIDIAENDKEIEEKEKELGLTEDQMKEIEKRLEALK